MTGRKTPEWIGKTPDTAIPPRVQLRLLDKHNARCALTGVKLRPGHIDFDHIIALANGGENRESNLQPVDRKAHKEKTKQDVAQKKKDRRVRAKHFGLNKPTSTLPGGKASKWKRKVSGEVVPRD